MLGPLERKKWCVWSCHSEHGLMPSRAGEVGHRRKTDGRRLAEWMQTVQAQELGGGEDWAGRVGRSEAEEMECGGGIPLAFGGSSTSLPGGMFKGPDLTQLLPLGFLLFPLLQKYHGFHPQPWDGRKDVELVFTEGLLVPGSVLDALRTL